MQIWFCLDEDKHLTFYYEKNGKYFFDFSSSLNNFQPLIKVIEIHLKFRQQIFYCFLINEDFRDEEF